MLTAKENRTKMIKLQPVLKDYLWGGEKLKTLFGRKKDGIIAESCEVSVHKDGESTISGTDKTFAEYLKENKNAVDLNGGEFPVLIKYIDAAKNLSVQVHPNDEYAQKYEHDNGKTEMWYIISADDGAGIYCGFKRDTNKEEFLAKVKDGMVEELLNFIPVKADDCYLIKAGIVHAIGAGCVICEIQQNSNVTYRVYDYNRRGADGKLRPLHVEKTVKEKKEIYLSLKQKMDKEQTVLNKLVSEVGRALIGESAFTIDVLNASISATKEKLAEYEKQIPQAYKEYTDKNEILEHLDGYYDTFKSWASEFATASRERKKMIICKLIDRIEIGKGYEIRVKMNINYEQFL